LLSSSLRRKREKSGKRRANRRVDRTPASSFTTRLQSRNYDGVVESPMAI